MSDTRNEQNEKPNPENPVSAKDTLAANDALLEEKLAQPVFRGDKGVDTAQVWMSAFLVVVVGIIAYSNAFRLPFQSEDQRLIVENTALHTMSTWADGIALWPEAPLAMLAFARNWWITPDNATAFHAFNILLHLLNGVLVFFLIRKLMKTSAPPTIPMLLAMLYVVHPIHTVSVDLIVGRANLMTLFLTLAGLLFYLRAITLEENSEPGAVRPVPFMLSLLCFVLVYFCGFAFAFLLVIAADIAFGRIRTLRHCLPVYALYGAACLLAVGARATMIWAITNTKIEALSLSECLRESLFLSNIQPLTYHAYSSLPITVAMIGIVIAIAFLYRKSAAQSPKSAKIRIVIGLLGVIVLFAGLFVTYQRNQVYANPFSLWMDAAARNPNAAEPLRQLGRTMLMQPMNTTTNPAEIKQYAAEAERYFKEALAKGTADADLYANLGEALYRQEKMDEARSAFLSGLELDMNHKECTEFLAMITQHQADVNGDLTLLSDAVDYYRKAHSLNALSPDMFARYGMALTSLGRFAEANEILAIALKAFQDNNAPKELIAQIENRQKNAQENAKQANDLQQQAITIQKSEPSSPEIPKLFAQSLLIQGRPLQAFYILDRFSNNPAFDFNAWLLMGITRARLKTADQFIANFSTPPAKPAEVPLAWKELAKACAGSGLWKAAQQYLECAPAVAEGNMTPLMTLAELARQLNQASRASLYLQKAAEAQPTLPQPWLQLCDLALSMKNTNEAANYLKEAEKRGATPDEITPLKQRLGNTATP